MKQNYETIDAKQLWSRMDREKPDNQDRRKGYALVNVLEPDSYREEHIPGSINIPAAEVEKFEDHFAKDKEIIVYCASQSCDASSKTASELSQRGFENVVDFEAGMRGWTSSGGPVDTGAA
jgi:rhodanese-related sulfurtransferase